MAAPLSARPRSAQLRVLGLGLLQDGDVGVGVFREIEEIILSDTSFGDIPLEGVGATRYLRPLAT
jgi:hypothetical protein